MVEIFNYNTSVYERYASETKVINDFRKELNLDSSFIRDVAGHTRILDFTPKPSALTTLMGLDQKTQWAFFSPPPGYFKQRFSTPYLVPSLGSSDNQDADIEKLSSFLKVLTNGRFDYKSKVHGSFDQQDPDQDDDDDDETEDPKIQEGKTLLKALDLGIKSSNVMIDYIISRIFQFVQG
ncbi:DUF5399 family protein [Chlamydiifrater phoenicopteri]|uniref:DUF5399 family protein n=1 Tax=Chlamydiifrater phoenicopteri TaxID=2681469 RepID=UPI001BCF184D|nr:DUF5399 family protein [Chlamydiifrater phoenicopteri]